MMWEWSAPRELFCEGGGDGFVDDAEDVEACDDTDILGGLTLSIVEAGEGGDDGVGNLAQAVSFIQPRTMAEVSSGV